MSSKITYGDITDAINDIANEINSILGNKRKDKYFHGVVLLYSFIENLIKWLIFVKLLWESNQDLSRKEIDTLQKYCKKLNFYNSLHIAFSLRIIEWKLFERIDSLRIERNDVIHQLWLYAHRGNNFVLRKKLEKITRVATDLLDNFSDLTREIGVDEVYELFL